MNHDELKRLRRLVVVLFVLLIIIVIGITGFTSFHVSRMNQRIAAIPTAPVQEVTQIQQVSGRDGYTPVKGIDYRDGQDGKTPECYFTESKCQGADGKNVTPEMVATAVVAYCEANNKCVGPEGPRGLIGRTVFSRINILTGLEECRFIGDEEWVPAEECQ